ncbi:Teneurin-1 [Armadillidium vulgare]|nr:Teneurin-1 [Armadillidium vulgare]
MCSRGWRGPDCSQMDTEALQCLPDCNKHGTFDINTHSCICNPPWTGSDCSKEAFFDCGPHGKCENEMCECEEGWTGIRCDERLCDSRCAEHGQCKNGTCVCMTGWNGRHCTLPGCPRNCMDHGKCLADEEGQWKCRCHEEWEGSDCSVRLELHCNDGNDNDNDGLKDCEDPECCKSPNCKNSQMCVSLPDPIDILLKMQPPAATASFYEKMQFIIQDNSLQSFPGAFNKR